MFYSHDLIVSLIEVVTLWCMSRPFLHYSHDLIVSLIEVAQSL